MFLSHPQIQLFYVFLDLINITQLLIRKPEDWLFSQTLLQSKNPIIRKLLQLQIINNSSHIMRKYQRPLVLGTRENIRVAKK
jgi:hypothetical protein